MPEIFFEDLTIGETETFGAYEVTEPEIIEFATKYDPQPFHTDPERATESPFGTLIASGWHTASICMRLFVDHHLSRAASFGGMGVDELRWKRPVYPGDVLSVVRTVRDKRVSESKPDRGIVRTEIRAVVQNDEEKMVMTPIGMYGRRP